jgi:hypothetical protein
MALLQEEQRSTLPVARRKQMMKTMKKTKSERMVVGAREVVWCAGAGK